MRPNLRYRQGDAVITSRNAATSVRPRLTADAEEIFDAVSLNGFGCRQEAA